MNPDLTMIRDPAQVWPDAQDCPDFPVNGRGAEPQPAWSREEAEARLRSLSRKLNPDGELREPTDEERADLMERYFKKPTPGIAANERMAKQGFPGLVSNRTGEGFQIAEAFHLRGYLRKLADHAASQQKATEQRDQDRLKSTVDTFQQRAKAAQDEAEALAESARRYRQWEADRLAQRRLEAIPDDLARMHRAAVEAASELGIEAPELPDLTECLT